MEQIQVAEFGHFRHARGKSKIVGWELKKRIAGDGHLVVEDAIVASAESEGLGVRNEVDLVAGSGKLDAEFGGYDSGTAVSGITGDADAHAALFLQNSVGARCLV